VAGRIEGTRILFPNEGSRPSPTRRANGLPSTVLDRSAPHSPGERWPSVMSPLLNVAVGALPMLPDDWVTECRRTKVMSDYIERVDNI